MRNEITPSSSTYQAEQAIWRAAAEKMGWQWSAAYAGYTRADHIKPETNGGAWHDYPSEVDAEEACDIDGIRTIEQALAMLRGYQVELSGDERSCS